MDYKERTIQINEDYTERLELVMGRIAQIAQAPEVAEAYAPCMRQMAEYLSYLYILARRAAADSFAAAVDDNEEVSPTEYAIADGFSGLTAEEGESINARLYAPVLSENYAHSYCNPAYACGMLGEDYGHIFGMLFTRLLSLPPYVMGGDLRMLCLYAELFVELYVLLEDPETVPQELHRAVASFMQDNSEIFYEDKARRKFDPQGSAIGEIVMEADLSDPAYLYRYGLYIGENERGIAAYLATLDEAQIQSMADTYTEGYRIGFAVCNKDIHKKQIVEVNYPVGFERMVRTACDNFRQMGMRCVLTPYTSYANRQWDYDHREDQALWLDKAYVERTLETARAAYEEVKDLMALYGGPAVIETFGEEPFSPEGKPQRLVLSDHQHELDVYSTSSHSRQINAYIHGEETSFTIISYPLPVIGPRFAEIFAETVRVNTLDYALYQQMQQRIIDVLDTADHVHIIGTNGNRTDLVVNLYKLSDPQTETIFENCVADVNIPVGEVFTTPVLAGTNGTLHVSQVYLNDYVYKDLVVEFTDGMISDYHCSNFEDEAANRQYIQDNVLMHHDSLPMGEFAIGTNTTAYRMGRVFDIADKLPILIAEKTGPHFAVGDTCYTYDEDNTTYNPDGKRIVARDNACSIRRKEDISKAYFNCHTDITIPYEEIGAITAVRADGSTADIIRNGRFVVPGTEELNRPLDDLTEE